NHKSCFRSFSGMGGVLGATWYLSSSTAFEKFVEAEAFVELDRIALQSGIGECLYLSCCITKPTYD
ncbi:MAG: hypothetical protein OXF73_12715, partial [Gammaproteobacteria bacterium]|nr:hypothetical protein [Gammaproteobacteria bacterium]